MTVERSLCIRVVLIRKGLPVVRECSTDVDEGALEWNGVSLVSFEDVDAALVVRAEELHACRTADLLRVCKTRREA
jgi:hypothetical protein